MGEKERDEPPQKWRKIRAGLEDPEKTMLRLVEGLIS